LDLCPVTNRKPAGENQAFLLLGPVQRPRRKSKDFSSDVNYDKTIGSCRYEQGKIYCGVLSPVAKTNLKGFRSRQVGYEPLQGCDGNDELKRHWC
jgi:hypothetical protein